MRVDCLLRRYHPLAIIQSFDQCARLRPLRALKRMPGMPVLVNSILAAVPKLGDVVIILGLLIVVMGIGIVHTFQGSTHYRCAMRGYVEPQTHPSLIIGDPAAVTYLSHRAQPSWSPAAGHREHSCRGARFGTPV